MNICIEYLVRTKAIREFFRTPCCLFLTKKTDKYDKIALVLKDTADGRNVLVSKYNLYRNYNTFSPVHVKVVAKERVFTDESIILPGYELGEYLYEKVAGYNAHNHPMLTNIWTEYSNNFLNSMRHKRSRTNWLWAAFVTSVSGNFTTGIDVSGFFINENGYCPKLKDSLSWRKWRWMFLSSTLPAAPELIFKPSFDSVCPTLILP